MPSDSSKRVSFVPHMLDLLQPYNCIENSAPVISVVYTKQSQSGLLSTFLIILRAKTLSRSSLDGLASRASHTRANVPAIVLCQIQFRTYICRKGTPVPMVLSKSKSFS